MGNFVSESDVWSVNSSVVGNFFEVIFDLEWIVASNSEKFYFWMLPSISLNLWLTLNLKKSENFNMNLKKSKKSQEKP